jgi:hypothetical protein
MMDPVHGLISMNRQGLDHNLEDAGATMTDFRVT